MTTQAPKPDRAAWIRGPGVNCSVAAIPKYPLRMVLLGPPGVGKGTQAELLCDLLGVCHLATGDIFRAAKKQSAGPHTPAMQEAISCMHRGDLVSDDTVLAIVRERDACLRCRGGFLLDGFPRTLAQAEALKAILHEHKLKIDVVINYQLPFDEIVCRLSGRRCCLKCRAVFHVTTNAPRVEGICDHCGATLYQRDDDRAESVHVRMQTYIQATAPLIQFYERLGLLVTIGADGLPVEILERTAMTLANLQDPAAHAAGRAAPAPAV
jgi:adenylate kinase